MKSKNIFLILFLCCTSLCFAQDKLFEKYADMDNVTSVFISKKMFDMIPNVESNGLNLINLKGKINNLKSSLPTSRYGTRCEKSSATSSANRMKN